MAFISFLSAVALLLFCSCSSIHCQQPYARKATTACAVADNSTSVLGYFCNGMHQTCQSYLTFRSQPPYNSVSSISTLLSSDPSQLSLLNSVSQNQIFETDRLVLVPVNCSCSGEYYQVNASYVIDHGNTHFLIANNTFQGLSTCQAARKMNENNLTDNLYTGSRFVVPLRCACPTRNQSEAGFKYLLSYVITWGDFVSSIAARFGADTGRTLEANELSEKDATIYPFTTLLVPLQNPPLSSQTIAPPPPPSLSPPSSPGKGSKRKWVYAVVGVVAASALVSVFCFLIFFRKRKRTLVETSASHSFETREKPPNKKLEEEESLDSIDISSVAQSLTVYKFGDLQSATENFSSSRLIGGSVYRGRINGDLAAIKQMNGDVSKEINLLNKINHFNLIRLSGTCFNEGHWYLVYEYAVNGGLSEMIYLNRNNEKKLTWTQRMQIALDVATGLNYLHSFTSPPLVHKDLKCSNILLDSDFRAKIANLGLSRSAEGREGQFSLTSHIVGTRGYMAPEYIENGLVSTKLDVYAFGVLLLEMITGKDVADLYEEGHQNLSEAVNAVLGQEDLSGFMDPTMEDTYSSELALFLVKLVDSCLSKNPAARPDTNEIVLSLSNVLRSSLNWEHSVHVSGYPSFRASS